jgi:hypothetical protein
MSTSLTTLSVDQTSLSAVQANILASSTQMVAHLNADLKLRYLSAFADYVTNMESGEVIPVDRQAPPKPPNAWELCPPDINGLVWYQVGTTPICDMPPLPFYAGGNSQPNTLPNVIMIGGQNGNTKWYSALKGDTFPSGMITPPQPDGHTYEKFGAPVGPGWYLQVS